MMIIFLFAYLFLSWVLPNPDKDTPLKTGDIGIQAVKTEIAQGNLVKVVVRNNTDTELVLGEKEYPPESLVFERFENGKWTDLRSANPEMKEEKTVIAPQTQMEFSFSEYNQELFFPLGKYRAVVRPSADQEFIAEFEVFEPGFFRTLFRAIYKVIYNTFILFLMLSGHSLGLAIILTTILIKTLLWGMNQKALESQKKMQKIQPELQKIKEKYKDNQQKMAQETLELWKKSGVSPFAAITPLFIQFPVLIALFYVIRDGLLPHNTFLLYPPFRDFDFSLIDKIFFIFNLSHTPSQDHYLLWLPFMVAGFQFWAMKLSFQRAKKKKEKEKEKKEGSGEGMMDQMETMNKMMTYFLPVMIFAFTFSFPAGVGVYWWISTILGIGQQWIVNKKSA